MACELNVSKEQADGKETISWCWWLQEAVVSTWLQSWKREFWRGMKYLEGIRCTSTAVCCPWLRLRLESTQSDPSCFLPFCAGKGLGRWRCCWRMRGRELCRPGELPMGCVAVRVQEDTAAPLLEAAPEGETCRTGWPLALTAFITKSQSRRKNLSESLMNHKNLGFLRQLQSVADPLRYYCPIFYRNA